MWSSLEKLAYPEWFYPFVEEKPAVTYGIARDAYIPMAGMAEFTLGFGLLWTPLICRLSAVALFVIFTAAVWPFGRMKIMGHGLIMPILLAVAADYSRESLAFSTSRQRHAAFRWALGACLSSSHSAICGLHLAFYGPSGFAGPVSAERATHSHNLEQPHGPRDIGGISAPPTRGLKRSYWPSARTGPLLTGFRRLKHSRAGAQCFPLQGTGAFRQRWLGIMVRAPAARDTSIATYRAKRDFAVTPEPAATGSAVGKTRRFVVQKHDARRLHWDFRLEHEGVLVSWAVPKGPSLDPADKRLAVRVEDHPLDYASFQGTIPVGNYGAGEVEIWDEGNWEPLGDPAADLAAGELKFRLSGQRLTGGFVLIRMKRRGGERAENWLLIKEHDAAEQSGADAAALEARPAPRPRRVSGSVKPAATPEARPGTVVAAKPAAHPPRPTGDTPVAGAVPAPLPDEQKPELATLVEEPPEGTGWLSEVKFDGYRLLIRKHGRDVRLITRNGLDWSAKLPEVVRAIARLKVGGALLDGELVALREDGLSSFANLQAALANGGDRGGLFLYLFDLLHLDGWDLRGCRLADRKAALRPLSDWRGVLRFSDHLDGGTLRVRQQACALGLEGIICKRADAPYRGARTRDWVKVKCQGRDEFVILGWTPPAGSRQGLGALHLGFHDDRGRLHYVGGVGTGFSEKELASLSRRLARMVSTPPEGLLLAGEPPDPAINWVRPELVAEVQYIGWTGFGRLRHAVYLGLREDKGPEEVVRDIPHPEVDRVPFQPKHRGGAAIVHAAKPVAGAQRVGGTQITHADRELWPGITKQDLAEYWRQVAARALPDIAGRPLALLRCPDGIEGQRFFQKHGNRGMPPAIHEGAAGDQPFLSVEDEAGLLACAQMAAIELHGWGASGADPLHPDRVVFDLDPGEGVDFAEVVRAALDLRKRLQGMGLDSFCRTTGGKGLHLVVPLRPDAGWEPVRDFAQGFAKALEAEAPDRFIATVSKAKRRGRILVDWLRNGIGATAICSYSLRARPGATVATPLAWREVTPRLDPQRFTIATVPARLRQQRRDPWASMATLDQRLPKEFR